MLGMGDEWSPLPYETRCPAEFVAQLRLLKQRSGLTYRQLEKRAAERGETLARSTLADTLRRDTLPRPEVLAAFVHACGEGRRARAWLEQWDSIAAAERTQPVGVHVKAPASAPPTELSSPPPPRRPRFLPLSRRRRLPFQVVWAALVAVLAIATGSFVLASGGVAGEVPPGACPDAVAPGEFGPCVQQVQLGLRRHSLDLPVDASFGPLTRARVAAFQAVTVLPVTGVVDPATRDAMGHPDSRVLFQTRRWSPVRVERRVRAAFPEDPEAAVALARCLSNLDPLWAWDGGEGDGTAWRWGLFQLTDREIKEFGGTARAALDPEWNIRTGRAIWERDRDFGRWACRTSAVE
jgi:hypothetical protein